MTRGAAQGIILQFTLPAGNREMRHLLLIGHGPIGVASVCIKRLSSHLIQAQPTQE